MPCLALPAAAQSLIPRNQAEPKRSILRAAFSPDGNLGALVYGDRVNLLNLVTWEEKLLLAKEGVRSLAFSPDSSRLAIAASGQPTPEIVLVDMSTGTVNPVAQSRLATVAALAFSPDGSLLAAGLQKQGDSSQMFLWNISDDRLIPLPTADKQFSPGWTSFSPDGESILTLLRNKGSGGEANLYATRTGSLIRRQKLGYGMGGICAFDGKMAAYCESDGRGANTIRLIDPQRGRTVRTIRGIRGMRYDPAFSADGAIIAVTAQRIEPQVVRRLNPDGQWVTTAEIRDFTGPQEDCRVQAWYPDKTQHVKIIADASYAAAGLLLPHRDAIALLIGSKWNLYDVKTGLHLESHVVPDAPSPLLPAGVDELLRLARSRRTFSVHRIMSVSLLDNQVIEAASDEGTAYFWVPATGKEMERNRFAASIEKIAATENGRTVIFQSKQEITAIVLDEMKREKRIRFETGSPASALAVSSRGDRMLIGGEDGSLRVMDTASAAEISKWNGHPGKVRAVALSPDAAVVASAGDDGKVRIWNAGSGGLIRVMDGPAAGVDALVFSPGGGWLAAGGDAAHISVWDLKTGNAAPPIGHKGNVRALRFSPDGSMLVSGGDESLQAWDFANGRVIKVLIDRSTALKPSIPANSGVPAPYRFEEISIHSISFSTDGSVLVCGGTNNTAIIWDTETWISKLFTPAADK